MSWPESSASPPCPGGAGILGVWYWAIPAAASQVDQAWTFIRWIASKAANTERVSRGGSPVRMSTMTDPRVWERGYGREYYEAVNAIHQGARPLVSGPECRGGDPLASARPSTGRSPARSASTTR